MPRPTNEERGEEKLERAVFYLPPEAIQRIEALKDRKNREQPGSIDSDSHMGRLVILAGLEALEETTSAK